MNRTAALLTVACCMLCLTIAPQAHAAPARPNGFPVATQFSPVPSGEGWKGEDGPLDETVLRGTIDNILAHGFTGIEAPTHRPADEEALILAYAASKGMFVSCHTGALEGFERTAPPEVCVYSPKYAESVRARVGGALGPLKAMPALYNAFTFQDEPFHWGAQSFGYGDEVKAEFRKRYGYDLPPDLDSIRDNPRVWLDVINFRSACFPDGWRQVYRAIKEINPDFKVTLTHDSHNTFGGGCTSHSELAIDDVFHWGGDFADLFVFDIYPYMMFDFRFGRPAQLPKPRISQAHYAFAQMRALTRAHNKELGFWVGTYNPAWFAQYLCPELAAMHWSEREMSMTAVAAGADYLLTGYKIPVDARHWECFGQGLRLIQKAGARLLDTPKVKAKACMLFPRTQYIQLQQEYFNVGLSFELFLRSFGELDIIHEDEVTDDTLGGRQLLVLFDVELLPEDVAARIARFVANGGTVIADCVPHMNAWKEPMATLEEVFGVSGMTGKRIQRAGHWVPYKTQEPTWANRPENPPDETVRDTDLLQGDALGQTLDLKLVSPRPCTVTTGSVLLTTKSGQPGLVRHDCGRGRAFLLGFCLQDTYFQTFEEDDPSGRAQMGALLRALAEQAGVRPHVRSSNPDIEASLRANDHEAFLFVINHESKAPATSVQMRELPFRIGKVTQLENDLPMAFSTGDGDVTLDLSVPLGDTALLCIQPDETPPVADAAPPKTDTPDATAASTFTLWQLPNQTGSQMMSYVMRTVGGKVIVIDGGMAGDAPFLAKFVHDLGDTVEAWFVTHAHDDHFGALTKLLGQPGTLRLGALYGSLPDPAWVDQWGDVSEKASYRLFLHALDAAGRKVDELSLGQTLDIDGIHIEILGVKNPEITKNPINNSSLVMRVSDAAKSVLFLADLGTQGGQKLLESPYAERLPSDYVQMAHHGQRGVEERFYQKVRPSYCLWPTPKWLWDNDNGGGPGSGTWHTGEVRGWMEKMPIEKHFVMFEGVREIR